MGRRKGKKKKQEGDCVAILLLGGEKYSACLQNTHTHILVLHLFTRDMASGHCVTLCHPASPHVRWSPTSPLSYGLHITASVCHRVGVQERGREEEDRTAPYSEPGVLT